MRDLSRILEHFAEHATPAELNTLAGEPAFKAFADMIAERMATGALTENARSWRMAAAKAGRGRMIFESLQQDITGSVQATLKRIVRENAELIRTLPIGLARKTTKYVATRHQAGVASP